MDQMTPIEEKKSFLRNDRLLVCSMLAFYGICILGLVGAAIWVLDRRSKTISANATSTAFAVATQQAKATATAAARATAQAQYAVIDRFDTNKYDWYVGHEDDEYWSGNVAIEDGVYRWDAQKVKQGFVYWSYFDTDDVIRDFDAYVDTRVEKGTAGVACGGLIFRQSSGNSKKGGYYYYALCNGSNVVISYHSDQDGWEKIAYLPSFSLFKDSPSREWNRMEVSARGSHFVFRVNGDQVYEMDDDRRKTGWIALVIEMSEENTSASILFDNFGFQPR